MGLFKKVKDILFDEEVDYTEQIKITPEMRNEQSQPREVQVVKQPVVKEEPVAPVVERISIPKPEVKPVEKEPIKSESTFPFFDFDEEEFTNQNPVVRRTSPVIEQPLPKRSTNVFEYERKKKVEKRPEYVSHSKAELAEMTEKRKFKPSPIISPVYGILDKNYSKDEILKRTEDKIDIKQIRDKAFGEVKKELPKRSVYEESKTVSITRPEEKEKKVKTIDELLAGTADVVVDLDKTFEHKLSKSYSDEDTKQYLFNLDQDELELPRKSLEELKEPEKEETSSSLDNDLFDLIDQMYNEKEEI